MIQHFAPIQILSITAIAASLCACAVGTSPSKDGEAEPVTHGVVPRESVPRGTPADEAPTPHPGARLERGPKLPGADLIAVATLELSVSTDTRVTGRFSLGDAAIAFDYDTSESGHTASVTSSDGQTLVRSSLKDGVETTEFLGGRLTVTGAPTETNPATVGDRQALVDFGKMPEARLVAELRESLAQAGVSRELYAPSVAKSDTAQPELSYMWLAADGDEWFGTWSFWGWTNVEVCDVGPYQFSSWSGEAQVFIGNSIYEDGWHTVYDPNGSLCRHGGYCNPCYQVAAQWWGFSVRVYNAGPDWVYAQVW